MTEIVLHICVNCGNPIEYHNKEYRYGVDYSPRVVSICKNSNAEFYCTNDIDGDCDHYD